MGMSWGCYPYQQVFALLFLSLKNKTFNTLNCILPRVSIYFYDGGRLIYGLLLFLFAQSYIQPYEDKIKYLYNIQIIKIDDLNEPQDALGIYNS